MIKAVIFDFDGVIVESVDIKTKAFANLFRPEGKDVAGKVVAYHVRHGGTSRFEKFKYIYRKILKRRLTPATFSILCNRFSALVTDAGVEAPFVKGADEFLNKNLNKYRFFVASATPQNEIDVIVRRRRMGRYFKKVFGSPMTKTDIVKTILSRERLLPSEVVFVGDALSDYRAARATKVHFIARIEGEGKMFRRVRCIKIKDLRGLTRAIRVFKI